MLKTTPGGEIAPDFSGEDDTIQTIESPLFDLGSLKEPELSDLLSCFSEVEVRLYPAKTIIFMPEDSLCERLYILREGRVDLYRLTAGGKKLVTRRVLPGSIFGIRAIMGRNMQKNIAEAVEDSTLYIINNRDQVFALLRNRPELMLRVLEAAYNRIIFLEELLVEAVYNPVNVKLAHFLLANIDSTGKLVNTTHEEIGNTIGAVRQTITETLSLMRKRGILITKRKEIIVTDRRKLEEIVYKQQVGA